MVDIIEAVAPGSGGTSDSGGSEDDEDDSRSRCTAPRMSAEPRRLRYAIANGGRHAQRQARGDQGDGQGEPSGGFPSAHAVKRRRGARLRYPRPRAESRSARARLHPPKHRGCPGEPRRAAREGTGGGELFPWTLVTVLQCGAVSSAGDASRDPQGRRERRRDLSTGAARWARDRQGAGRDAPGPA